ncbi:HAD family phosphatase [Spirosoma horti]
MNKEQDQLENKSIITTLFIDIGGVLLTNGWDQAARSRAAETFDLDLPDLEERHHLTFDTYETGKLTLDDYLSRIVFYKRRHFSMDSFREFMFAQSQPYPEMIALIRHLKERYRLKIAVVSNEGRELNMHRIQTFRLTEFIDFFVSSSFVHLRKPDADIFQMAIDLSQTPTNQIIYIDDRPLFVAVAAKLGIQGICHIDYQTTRTALANKGLNAEPA